MLICMLALLAACSSAPSRPPVVSDLPVTHDDGLDAEVGQNVALYALGLVGTPYRYGGNTPAGGFDCSGLIGFVYRSQAGLRAPRTVLELQGWGQPVVREQVRTGDLVLFSSGGSASHAGVYVGAGRFVHAPSTGGSVRLDRLDGPYWSRQIVAFRRP